MKQIVVITPAFNEEKTIPELVRRINELKDTANHYSVLIVDDGSTDHTIEAAQKSGSIVLHHERNEGVGRSIQDGIQYALEAGADIAVIIDADLQYDPEDITTLIQPILIGQADFVTADRFIEKTGIQKYPENMPRVKYWGNNRMTSLVNRLAGTSLGDVSSGFRALNREAILNLNLTGNFTYTHEMILDLALKNLKLMSIPIHVRYFKERKSRVAGNLFSYAYQASRIIFKKYKDYRPFRFFAGLAILPLVIGFISLVFMLIHYLVKGAFTPYKFVGFIGIYLVSLGILLVIVGFVADILVGLRMTEEKILYYQKKDNYKKM